MISADVWIAEYGQHGDDWEWIKQIQLDAMKEGAKRVSDEIDKTESPHNSDATRIQQTILSTAEQWSIKDL